MPMSTGEWLVFEGGVTVYCQTPTSRRPRFEHRPCGASVIRVGRSRRLRIRIVGARDIPVSSDIEGDTIRCRDCKTIYEVDWEDRRSEVRVDDDRRVPPGQRHQPRPMARQEFP